MAGIVIKTDNKTVLAGLDEARAGVSDVPLMLRVAGELMRASIARTFRGEGSPAGSWPRLAASTLKKKGYTSGHKLLILSGRLFGSITYAVTGNTLEIGTNVVYAAVQQFGSADRRGGSIGAQAHCRAIGEERTPSEHPCAALSRLQAGRPAAHHVWLRSLSRGQDGARRQGDLNQDLGWPEREHAGGDRMSTAPVSLQGSFSTLLVWQTVQQMLTDQLPGVDVQAVSNADFNGEGALIMSPPSIRIFFAGERAGNFGDAQRLSYNAVQRYMVTCADQSLTAVLADQAMASAALADKAKNILAGARISLVDGEQSEPVAWIGTEPVEIADLGTGYAVAIEVEGIAQFAGLNAAGYQMSSAEQAAQTVGE